MKFLIIGLGSTGKRRIRNLKYLQSGTIIGCDPRLDRRDETSQRYRIQTYEDFSGAMSQNPDVLIISTSPDLHMRYALEAVTANKHFFTEASVVDDHLAELIAQLKEKKIVAAPSCTMCFYPGPKKIRKLLQEKIIGQPLTFTYHSSQCLRSWHPREDYQAFSDSQRRSRIYREIVPFELVWLSSLFGDIESISGFQGKVGQSKTNNDAYHLLLKFESGLIGHLLVDMFSRSPLHQMQILGTKGHIEWNNQEQLVRVYSPENTLCQTEHLIRGCVENMYINLEEPYIDELRCFLDAVHGITTFPHTFEKQQKALNLLFRAGSGSSIQMKEMVVGTE